MRSTQERPAVDELLRLQDVRKVYGRSRNSVAALAGVSLGFRQFLRRAARQAEVPARECHARWLGKRR